MWWARRLNGPSQAGDAQSGDTHKNSSGASIYISVKLPGHVVQTNGTVDSFNGDISWSFYPEAAAFEGDIAEQKVLQHLVIGVGGCA